MEWSQVRAAMQVQLFSPKTKTYPGITENRGYVNQGSKKSQEITKVNDARSISQ